MASVYPFTLPSIRASRLTQSFWKAAMRAVIPPHMHGGLICELAKQWHATASNQLYHADPEAWESFKSEPYLQQTLDVSGFRKKATCLN
eukprot:4240283-Amphidinium_carterae.1